MTALDLVVDALAEQDGLTSAELADRVEHAGLSRRAGQRAVSLLIIKGWAIEGERVHARDPRRRGCMARRLHLVG